MTTEAEPVAWIIEGYDTKYLQWTPEVAEVDAPLVAVTPLYAGTLPHRDRKAAECYIAALLGYDPKAPETWPTLTIARVHGAAEAAYREVIHREVRSLNRK
jgi:hypothetical protein